MSGLRFLFLVQRCRFEWLAANPNGTRPQLVDVLLAEPNPVLLIDAISRAAAQRAAERVFAVRAGV